MVNKLLSKLMFRELKKNAVSYLAMFFIVLLAVTLFLGFLSNSFTLEKRAELYYEEANLADLVVQTTSLSDADKEYLNSIEDAQINYRVYSDGSFQAEGKDSQTAELYLYDENDGTINAAYITEGTAGFVIDARVAELHGYEIGDAVTVEITSFKSILSANGLPYELEFEITGLAHFVDRVNVYSVSAVYISTDTFVNALLDYTGYPVSLAGYAKTYIESLQNQALILCSDPSAVKTVIENYFTESGNGNLLFVYDHDTMESVVTIDSEVDQSLSMIYVFPVIFFVVALLVVMATISRLILRERTNIGTMKALGISDAKIIFLYAFLSAFVTLLGCILGAVLGPLIVPNVMSIKYTLMFSMPQLSGIVVSIPWTVITAVFVCICAMAIAIWASRSVIKEMPAECMRPRKIEYHSKEKHKKAETSSEKSASHTALSCRMAVRNIRINWGRAIMTIIGVAGCSALLLTSFGIGDTLAQSVDNDLVKLFTYDVSSSYLSSNKDEVCNLLDSMKSEGGISAYENVYTYNVPLSDSGESFSVYVFEKDTEMTAATADGIAISQNKADDLGLTAGDIISFKADGKTVTYTIDAVIQTSLLNGLFISDSDNAFSDGVYCSESVWIKTDDPETVKEILNEVNGTLDAQTKDERIDEVNSLISSTNTMKYTLMVFAILLSVVVLYNLSLLNVKERTRDMATLKVLGYTHFQIALSLILEIMLLTLAGIAIGCVLGYPLLWLVMTINEVSVIAFIITLNPLSYVYSVLIAAGTAAVINILFGFMITRIDMTESLKSVE